jgi:hypothetical protein
VPVSAMEHVSPFGSAVEQIEEELRWLSRRLAVVIERSRKRRSVGPPPEYRGLYVTDEEVDTLLRSSEAGLAAVEQLIAEAAELRDLLDARADVSKGLQYLPLDRVSSEFGLSAAERLVLVITLAPYYDTAFEKIYAYANDDITRRWPTVELALEILHDERRDRHATRSLFYQDAPLALHSLVTAGAQHPSTPALPNWQLLLDQHVAEVLLGYRGLDPRLQGVAVMAEPEESSDSEGTALARVLQERRDARVYVGGRWQAEKAAAILHACSLAGFGLIPVDTKLLQRSPEPATLLNLALRDARLLNAALLFEGWGGFEGDQDSDPPFPTLTALLSDHPLPLFFSDRAVLPSRLPVELHLHYEFPAPRFEERQRVWQTSGLAAWHDAGQLAATYRFGLREIRAAAEMSRSIASLAGRTEPALEDLKAAARTQSQPRLISLAQRISPHFTWDDIVLPPDRLAQLREIANQVLYQHVVYEDWGLAHKSSLGRGVAALFAGQSGTGKTMAAQVIGQELGLEVYKIDLSGLVSKYIGETEKNLARVFEEASDTNVILFFDEADAVFGKRSEVRDSHDRYANIEVSYLLQKMEEYDGIVILATNLRSNLDEAFLRRLRAIVEFPFPEADDRLRIWQRTLSASAPIAADVDLGFMSRQFRIAGGNIRNIVLLAAFLTASDEGAPAISMHHLIQATKREYQKLGRLVTESDFGKWYEQVRP